MAQLNPVAIPNNTWVDLYSATSISVGTQIVIQNTGAYAVKLSDQASIPLANEGFNLLEPREYVSNKAGAAGAWAFSGSSTLLQVDIL